MRVLTIADPALRDRPLVAQASDEPSHVRIERWLAARVAAGALQQGDKLPAEEDFAAFLGVSRMTLRQALGSLEAKGVIERRRGRAGGSFVRTPGQLPAASFTEQLRDARMVATVVSADVVDASVDVAHALRLDAGDPVVAIVRVRSDAGEPVVLERMNVPAALCPDLLERQLTGSLASLLHSAYGLHVSGWYEWLQPDVATPERADLLRVAVGAPLLQVTRTGSTPDGLPVAHAVDHYRADHARVALRTGTAT